jgi:1-acyl-sn-glycerol-3-phosphate acyltransferase
LFGPILCGISEAAGDTNYWDAMIELTRDNSYHSPEREPGWFARFFPSAVFYAGIVYIILKSAGLARRGEYDAEAWIASSLYCVNLLERVGGRFVIENLDVVRSSASPCVFIGNHMSVLETFILPCLIRPYRNVTFVIKESLIAYPAFKHVMASREPIVVGRMDPRQDLRTVLTEGEDRLKRGTSVIVFPQTTRSLEFDSKKFNSLGVKLARRTGVPVVPVALKTDAWGVGAWFKDVGSIRPRKTARFYFGEPLSVAGSGREVHQVVVDLISGKLNDWKSLDPA